jgi:putative hydrolase of HD superfamily
MPVITSLAEVFGAMKVKPRTGWVDHEIVAPETVWGHSVDMWKKSRTLGSYYLGPKKAEHCGELGLVHDVTEGIVPDITPHMGITLAQKHELEMMAINHIGTLPRGGDRVRDLWLEFEDQKTPEAKFVHKTDKMHVAYVALEYEREDRCRYSLQPFWDYAAKHVANTPLQEVFDELVRQRPVSDNSKPVLERRPNPAQTFETIREAVLQKIGR